MHKYCGPRATKPDIFSRKEIEELAKKKLGLKPADIRSMSKLELCKLLKLPLTKPITPPSSPKTGDCFSRSQKKLQDHQEKVVRHMMKHHGLIVFHKVGSGKTLTAITVSQCYLDKFPTHKVVVVAPAGLINNFKKEMTESYKNLNFPEKYHFYSFQTFMNLGKTGAELPCKDSLLIVDEAHNLRSLYRVDKKGKEHGIMNRYVTDCAKKAHKVLLLTATPLYNSIDDIKALYNMIGDLGEDFSTKDLECKISYRGDNPHCFPKRKNINEYIIMSDEYQKKYEMAIDAILHDEVKHKLISDLYGEDKQLKSFYNGIRRAVNNLEDTKSAKIQWIIKKLKAEPVKTIVFSHFLDAGIKCVIKALKGVKHASVSGSIPLSDRKKIVQDFNDDKIRFLFISKAGGEGLDLKGVRNIIIMEPAWNEATEEQIIGRGIRFKSHEHLPKEDRVVNVYYLYHIQPDDVKYTKGSKSLLKYDPYEVSFDIYMNFLKKQKQKAMNKQIEEIKKISIENIKC